ncbi:CAP domain-containing protein [Alkalicoccus daliensis]|uniref:Uncharacterized protein, YkwD family n=1 Tax=Alkalicoccus daliensis TaxID=745820 RepID=A0A1H0GWG6_9BACI|nr:CAP domain-containing protein [Alkalicoccus daliensis]SDO11132.1 uncharacterized protein, YkwD family [Alkalicoccus daliensis]
MNYASSFRRYIISLIGIAAFFLSGNTVHASFPDVSSDHYAYEHIQSLLKKDILAIDADGRFRPEYEAARGQQAIMVGRALDIETESENAHTYQDVNSQLEGYQYIYALTAQGIFKETEFFYPGNSFTRAEMNRAIIFAAEQKETFSSPRDVLSSLWSAANIDTLLTAGLTKGEAGDSFGPEKPMTRAQAAVYTNQISDYLSGEQVRVPLILIEDFATPIEEEILKLTNEERAAEGIDPLEFHSELREVAMVKAEDMHINNYFAHESPEHGDPFQMILEAGITFRNAGENIAYGQPSAEEVIKEWMESPGHRENIMNENYTHLGVGYYEGGRTYYVQMFMQP